MKKTSITNRLIFIFIAFFFWYLMVGEMLMTPFDNVVSSLTSGKVSNGMAFVLEYYLPTIVTIVAFLIMCLIVKKDRPMLEVVKPAKEKRSMHWLLIGLLLGFLTNFFCILCALIHGDIKLYFDFSAGQIPLMIFALVCVFIQSSSEEIWCRVMLYERANVHYPLWVAIVFNGTIFGLLHSFNSGITPLAMADLIICGLSYSLLRWYTGSIWACFGIHTMWNFTQNFLFGLPNSGLVSECSVFHMDAVNATSNLIYSYEFGVEGAVPAIFIDLVLAAVILWLAKKNGRLGELLESRESRGEAPLYAKKEAKTVEF